MPQKWKDVPFERRKEYYTRYKAKHPIGDMLRRAKVRAKKKNIPFDLVETDITIPEYCPVLGIKLKKRVGSGGGDSSPSLDRIIPALGYVKGNVIVVSHKANAIKFNATPDEIITVGEFYRNLINEKNVTSQARNPNRDWLLPA